MCSDKAFTWLAISQESLFLLKGPIGSCRGVMHTTDVKNLTVQGPTALPWESRSAAAGAGPSGAPGPGGSALQPWGDNAGASATGASGHERSGNAEITPLEVTS